MLLLLVACAEALNGPSSTRRAALQGAAAAAAARAAPPAAAAPAKPAGFTNEVVRTVEGIRHKRLGGTDIVVSEMGLGTQRWGSADFNAPDEALCHQLLDRAVLKGGINLVDTAEQYPIPLDRQRPEGETERIIGTWLKKDAGRRKNLVIASKITGGGNINRASIEADLRGSLERLGTDYLDVYLLHWPARYTPQANWGQSLEYKVDFDAYAHNRASFDEIAETMGGLVRRGLIRGWGMCNDNCYGLTASTFTARAKGVAPPCTMQNDYSVLNRRIEENGQAEAASPFHENVGFMAYNTLAGGVLTGKSVVCDSSMLCDDARLVLLCILSYAIDPERSPGRPPIPILIPIPMYHTHRQVSRSARCRRRFEPDQRRRVAQLATWTNGRAKAGAGLCTATARGLRTMRRGGMRRLRRSTA